MNKLNELKVRFKTEGKIRGIVYLISLLITIVVFTLLNDYSGKMDPYYKAMIVTCIPTTILVYISDSFRAYKAIIGKVSSVCGAFAGILASLTAFTMGLGGLFGIAMQIGATIAVMFGGVMFVYTLPVIFIPFLGFLARKMYPAADVTVERAMTKKNASENNEENKMEEEVNWNRVYAGVKAGMGTSND